MKIVQVTRTIDTQTFEPISVITLEAPIRELRTDLSDEEIERHLGQLLLKAMLEYIREQGVTDVAAKAQEIREQEAEEAHA